jgi:hypothetical protein
VHVSVTPGEAYSTDNKLVYCLLKSFLDNTSGWTWIEPYNATENGCGWSISCMDESLQWPR